MKLTELIKPDDLEFMTKMAEKPDPSAIDEWMPWVVRFLIEREENLISALKDACPDLDRRDDIMGYAVTADEDTEDDEIRHLPVIFTPAPSDVCGPRQQTAKDLGLPECIEFEGEQLPLQIIALEEPQELQCIAGIPIEQHQRIRPVRPGTAIRGLDPANNNPKTDGSGGAIVRRRPVQPNDPLFLLSARHVLKHGNDLLTMMQPWLGNPITEVIGSTIAVSAAHDSGICEIPNGDPDIMCIGRPKLPVPPFTTMRIQKSGAATGHTGSFIQYNRYSSQVGALQGTRMFFASNIASYPVGGAGVTQNFIMGGDSGSMAVVGNPRNPRDFGRFVNWLIRFLSAVLVPSGLSPFFLQLWEQRLTNAAVGLITHATMGQVTVGGVIQGVPVAVGLEIQVALDDLGIDLVL